MNWRYGIGRSNTITYVSLYTSYSGILGTYFDTSAWLCCGSQTLFIMIYVILHAIFVSPSLILEKMVSQVSVTLGSTLQFACAILSGIV